MIVMLWGAGIGTSLLLLVTGLRPAAPSLAEAQQRISAAPIQNALVSSASAGRISVAGPAVRLLASRGLPGHAMRANLALAGVSVEDFLTRKVLYAVVGVFMPACAQLALVLAHLAVPGAAVVAVSAVLAVWFFFVPDGEARAAARAVREQTREALEVLLSFTATSMAAGEGIESAIEGSATIGEGRAFEYFGAAVDAARTSRRPVWACFGELADTLGVAELGELAATMNLAGGQGARIAESLSAKAASLRGRRRADRQAKNVAATERAHMPVSVMMLGFLLVLVFPSLDGFLTHF